MSYDVLFNVDTQGNNARAFPYPDGSPDAVVHVYYSIDRAHKLDYTGWGEGGPCCTAAERHAIFTSDKRHERALLTTLK